ncbi:hypothetical protein KSP40_PGU004415 [Platanthera guangdongensis]|uniref:GIY-YIG homing endonuclease n=1 Tax=Platanthera guangdongensis TaxID=2320717 RepID=A0ABR2MWG8_9ASPA
MRISERFPSRKSRLISPSKISSQTASPSSPASVKSPGGLRRGGGKGGEPTWSVYLIVSSQLPRTYVGVTTNLFRRCSTEAQFGTTVAVMNVVAMNQSFIRRKMTSDDKCDDNPRKDKGKEKLMHNGELKGGAKASSAGRPWSLACLIQGFKDRSEGTLVLFLYKFLEFVGQLV